MVSKDKRSKESGNVLFLILIAVALFAALSYAVTSSTRSGGGDASSEKKSLIASQIVQFGSAMESAVLRMRLSGGCSETDISFESDSSEYASAHTPPVADKCKVFHPLGGGISYQEPEGWFFNSDETGYTKGYRIWASGNMSINNVGTSAPDLVFAAFPLSKELCHELNTKLGISYSGTSPPGDTFENSGSFVGTYTLEDTIGDGGAAAYSGKRSGCFHETNDDDYYVYYHVLIPR